MRLPIKLFLNTAVLLSAAVLLPSSLKAAQINWSNLFGGVNVTSLGADLDGSFVFELGAFEGNFDPAMESPSDWAANWVALDRSEFLPALGFFGGTATLDSNSPPFTTIKRAYIWGFSCKDGVSEWVLFENTSWQWPSFSSGIGFPIQWSLADAGTTTVIGTLSMDAVDISTANVGSLEPPSIRAEAWRDQHFRPSELSNPAISGWGEDPDFDGCTNLIEFVGGTDPLSGLSLPEFKTSVAIVSGNAVHQLRLARLCRAEIGITAQKSSDLVNWSTASITVVSDTSEELVFECVQPSVDGARSYLRLSVATP